MKKLLFGLALLTSLTSFAAQRPYPYKNYTSGRLASASYNFHDPSVTAEGLLFYDDLERESRDYDCVSNISLNLKPIKSRSYGLQRLVPWEICTVNIEVKDGNETRIIKYSESTGTISSSGLDVLMVLPIVYATVLMKHDCAYSNGHIRDMYTLINERSLFCRK